jgi:hypothetical protein
MRKFKTNDRVIYKGAHPYTTTPELEGEKGTVQYYTASGGVSVTWDNQLVPKFAVLEDNLTLIEENTQVNEYEKIDVSELREGDKFRFTVANAEVLNNKVKIGCKTFSRSEIEEVANNVERIKRDYPQIGEVWSFVWTGYDQLGNGIYQNKPALVKIIDKGVQIISTGKTVLLTDTFMNYVYCTQQKKIQNADGTPA